MDLDAQLKIIVANAKDLADRGVEKVRVGVDYVEFTLQQAIPDQPTAVTQSEDKPQPALEDAKTYGYADGSALPGFRDPRKA